MALSKTAPAGDAEAVKPLGEVSPRKGGSVRGAKNDLDLPALASSAT
jgi:hypothetical protein